jgi:hypothetical protein
LKQILITGTVPTANTATISIGDKLQSSNELSQGLAVRIEQGRSFGFSIAFYRGVHFRQEDLMNPGYGFNEQILPDINSGVSAGSYNIIAPSLLFRSPDLKRLSELKKWMEKSPDFKKWFEIQDFTFNLNDDLIVSGDISKQTALSPYSLFTGGSTIFSDQVFAEAIEISKSLDNSFYLPLGIEDEATNAKNEQIFSLLTSGDLRWTKYGVVGAYGDSASFNQDTDSSVSVAKFYNSSNIITVHGYSKVANNKYPDGYRNISMLEKASKVLGRICGLSPQTPITFKDIAIDNEVHKLKESEKEFAIENGILCTNYDSELNRFVILAGINTLGDNDFLVNEDASSYDIAVERIKSQLNKEIIYNAKQTFFNNQTSGPNRNTVSPEDIKTWLGGFLESKVAKTNQDNLIIRYGSITVKTIEDNYFVEYEFVPNYPVSKVVFVGLMLSA